MVMFRLYIFILISILFASVKHADAQCGAKIGIEPGSSTIGCGYPLAIRFNSSGSFGVQELSWNFGDGKTSNTNNPLHEFYYDSIQKKDALYKVVLTVKCLNGSTVKDSVNVTALMVPKVIFTPEKYSACQLGESICFTNNSDFNASFTYQWNFDLGETSNQFSPCNTFSLSGFKKPRLSVSTPAGCENEYTLPGSIEILAVPNPSFIANPQTACNPMTVNVTNNTNVAQVNQVEWDWGDGDKEYTYTPQPHIYDVEGMYTLKLKIINFNGCANTAQVIITNQPSPAAKISLSTETICLNTAVQVFQDTTSYDGAVYTWDFDNPTQVSGSGKGPYNVTWGTPGLKNVKLDILLNGCVGSVTKYVFVNPYSMVHLEQLTKKTPLCELDEIKFTASPNYYSQYGFIVNGDTLQYSNSPLFTTKNLKKNDKVNMFALDRFNCPCHTVSPEYVMNVTPLPLVSIISDPSGTAICKGDTLELTATPAGYDDYYFYDGNNLLQKAGPTLVLDYNKASGSPIRALASENGCLSDSTKPSTYIIPEIKESLTPPQVFCGDATNNTIEFAWNAVAGAVGYEISLEGGPYEPINGVLSHSIAVAPDSVVHAFVKAKGILPCGDSKESVDSAVCISKQCTSVDFTLSPDVVLCEGESSIISINNITVPESEIFWNESTTPSSNRLRVVQPTQSGLYYVHVKNADPLEAACPGTKKFIQITVNAKPVVSLTATAASAVICENAEIEYSANPSTYQQYEFYNNYDLVQTSTSPKFVVGNHKNDQYIKVRAIQNNCKSELSNAITNTIVKPLKQTQVVCGTTSVNSVNFVWDAVPNATSYMLSIDSIGGVPNFTDIGNVTQFSIADLQLGESRTITVKPVGLNTCGVGLEYASATCFTENCVPITFTKSQDLELCEGSKAYMYIANVSVPNYAISWDGKTYSNKNVKYELFPHDTIIMVAVRNNYQPQCNPSKKYFKVKVNPMPVVTLTTAEYTDTICSGHSVTFVAKPSGFDEYFFYDNWKLVQSGTSPIYAASNYYHQHEILVKAKNNGCLNPTGTTISRDVILPLEAPQVNCGTTTTGSVEFVWDSIPGATSYEVSINDNTPIPANGSFSHTVSAKPSTEIFIEVFALGDTPCGKSLSSSIWSGSLNSCVTKDCSPINFTRPEHKNICSGEQVNLEISDLTEAVDYGVKWNNEAETKSLQYVIQPLVTDTVSIEYTDKNQVGCDPATKYTVIQVFEIPVASLSSQNDTACQYSNMPFSASVAGLDQYSFYSESTLLYAGTNYQYDLKNIVTDTTCMLRVSHQGCVYNTNTVNLKTLPVAPIQLVTSAINNLLCENDTLNMQITGVGYKTYEFYRDTALLQSGNLSTYNLPKISLLDSVYIDNMHAYAYNEFGCKSIISNVIKHTILPKTNVIISANKANMCLNDDVTFIAIPSGLSTYTFLQNKQSIGTQIPNQYTTTTLLPNTTVQVLSKNQYGCMSDTSNAILVNVNVAPVPVVSSSDTVICVGDAIVLTADVDPLYPTAQVYWSTNQIGENATVTPSLTMKYSAYTMYNNCKSNLGDIEIEVDQQKVAIDSVLPITACKGSVIELPGNGGTNYSWYPADSVSNPLISNPFITVWETQTYTYVVSNKACVDSSKILVNMDLCLTALQNPIPEIITPNNDGVNDFWVIKDIDYFTNNSVIIYNRWGEKVYDAAPYNNTWNGNNLDNKELPNGSYFYKLDLGPNMKSYSGYVIINK